MKKIVAAGMIVTAILLCGLAIKEELPYFMSDKKNKEIRAEYIKPPETQTEPDPGSDSELEREVDFLALQAINPDIVGWIYVPGTPIDYPILKNPTDNFYLSHDFTGSLNIVGSIFMQAAGDESFNSEHNILYGHNLVDNQMFGSLSQYSEKKTREEQPYIYIYQPTKARRYRIYSAYECADGTQTYQLSFATQATYKQWVDFTVAAGGEEPVQEIRKVLTLSTCTSSGTDRFVVHGSIDKEQIR